MELSTEILMKLNQASSWWTSSVLVSREAEKRTIDLVHTLLKEVGKVEFDECHRKLEHPYFDGYKWGIGCIKELYINEYDTVVAVLVDGEETCFENFDCLTDSAIWDSITDSLGLNEGCY